MVQDKVQIPPEKKDADWPGALMWDLPGRGEGQVWMLLEVAARAGDQQMAGRMD